MHYVNGSKNRRMYTCLMTLLPTAVTARSNMQMSAGEDTLHLLIVMAAVGSMYLVNCLLQSPIAPCTIFFCSVDWLNISDSSFRKYSLLWVFFYSLAVLSVQSVVRWIFDLFVALYLPHLFIMNGCCVKIHHQLHCLT